MTGQVELVHIKNKNSNLSRYLYVACAIVMPVGMLSAGLVYYFAADGGNHGLGYDVVGGSANAAGESKAYALAIAAALISYACFWFARELELFGTDEPND